MDEETILCFFEYDHLPPHLARTSEPFCKLAKVLTLELEPGPQRTHALQKLLEAKDCAVRATLSPGN